MEKFKRWVEKAILLNPRLGDAWAYLYLEQIQNGQNCDVLLKNMAENRPKFGRIWS